MKFIPNPSFERLNSVLGGVDNALGCRSTIRVEAFSCRKSKEEKRTAQVLAQQQQQQQQRDAYNSGESPMGFPAASFTSEPDDDDAPSTGNAAQDQRFLFLVSCLNALYGDEYDFTVLSPSAFQLCEPYAAMAEVDQLLSQMPPELLGQNARQTFWSVLGEVLAPGAGSNSAAAGYPMSFPASPSPSLATECDFFKFVCPECDPTAQSKLWSLHYLLYARRSRLMVSLLAFGEGNAYRGDDGYRYGRVGSPSQVGPSSDSPMYYVEPDDGHFPSAPPGFLRGNATEESIVTEEDEWYGGGQTSQKNRDFWGFGE